MDDQTSVATVRTGTKFNDDILEDEFYTLADQIGSGTDRLNTSGTLIDKEEFYPFGDSSLRTFTKKRYRYVGKEKDQESGLYYYGARYYAAWTCRFISIDPLASDYMNLTPYQNAGNKPITYYDIDGLQSNGDPKTPNNQADNTSTSGVTNRVMEQKGADEFRQSQLDKLSGIETIQVVHNIDGNQVTVFKGSPEEASFKVIDRAVMIVENIGAGTSGSIVFTATGGSEEIVGHFGFHVIEHYADFNFKYSYSSEGNLNSANGSFKELIDSTRMMGVPDAALMLIGYQASRFIKFQASKQVPGPSAVEVSSSTDDLIRVRHHTNTKGLDGIKKQGSINASRGKPEGVDVEVSPFIKPSQVELGQAGRGSYVEFSVPRVQLQSPPGYLGGSGNAGRLVTNGVPYRLKEASPKFVYYNFLGL